MADKNSDLRLFKRYADRKVYDTATATTVNLAYVADVVIAGEDVTVIDDVTGDDITARWLALGLASKLKELEGDGVKVHLLAALRCLSKAG